MAINRFATGTPYGCIELNSATWPRDGRVPSQLPLSSTSFGNGARCENGFWLVYDEVAKEVKKPGALTDTVAVVYSAEKDYGLIGQRGLGYFSQGAGDMPRLGRPVIGDKYTTNVFCYDTTTFENQAVVEAVLAAYATTALYLIPSTTGAPQLVLAGGLSTATTIAKVIKYYTVPNGNPGIKVEFTKVNS